MVMNVEVNVSKKNNIGAKTRQGIENYLKKGADKGVAVASDKVPVDRGAGGGLLSGIFSPEVEGDRVIWGIRDMKHARPIEFGTDPFYPPLKPLLEWSQRVSGGKGLGFYVARHKIPEEGIDSQPYIRPARKAQISWYKSHSASDFIQKEL
jgi:hypothetical protein